MTEAWHGYTFLADADSRRAFLATTRSVIDTGGQRVTAHDDLPMATRIPTLVVWGTRDRMIAAWHATTAHQAFPGSRVELFVGAGHFPHLDEPARFAEVLRDFFPAEGIVTARMPALRLMVVRGSRRSRAGPCGP